MFMNNNPCPVAWPLASDQEVPGSIPGYAVEFIFSIFGEGRCTLMATSVFALLYLVHRNLN